MQIIVMVHLGTDMSGSTYFEFASRTPTRVLSAHLRAQQPWPAPPTLCHVPFLSNEGIQFSEEVLGGVVRVMKRG